MRLGRLLFWTFLICFAYGIVNPPGSGTPDGIKALVAREWPSPTPAVMAKAAAVSGCEAGWRNHAVGDGKLADEKWGPSLGPFQVRSLWSDIPHFTRFVDGRPNRNPLLLWMPAFNAHAAYDISAGGTNWSAWTCGGA